MHLYRRIYLRTRLRLRQRRLRRRGPLPGQRCGNHALRERRTQRHGTQLTSSQYVRDSGIQVLEHVVPHVGKKHDVFTSHGDPPKTGTDAIRGAGLRARQNSADERRPGFRILMRRRDDNLEDLDCGISQEQVALPHWADLYGPERSRAPCLGHVEGGDEVPDKGAFLAILCGVEGGVPDLVRSRPQGRRIPREQHGVIGAWNGRFVLAKLEYDGSVAAAVVWYFYGQSW